MRLQDHDPSLESMHKLLVNKKVGSSTWRALMSPYIF